MWLLIRLGSPLVRIPLPPTFQFLFLLLLHHRFQTNFTIDLHVLDRWDLPPRWTIGLTTDLAQYSADRPLHGCSARRLGPSCCQRRLVKKRTRKVSLCMLWHTFSLPLFHVLYLCPKSVMLDLRARNPSASAAMTSVTWRIPCLTTNPAVAIVFLPVSCPRRRNIQPS